MHNQPKLKYTYMVDNHLLKSIVLILHLRDYSQTQFFYEASYFLVTKLLTTTYCYEFCKSSLKIIQVKIKKYKL